jgi:capsular polysaccharide biosynthesis protein
MSQISRPVQTVRRHQRLIGIVAAAGLLAGGAYAVLKPPLITSTAEVLLSEPGQAAQAAAAAAGSALDLYTPTQEVIAKSDPVLLAALPDVRPAVSLNTLRRNVEVGSPAPYVISISAQAKTASDAAATANAVANSYVAYVTPRSSLVGQITAQMLSPATVATGTGIVMATLIKALLGALLGAVVAAAVVLWISRKDRRLRERDDIANSIGIPVLASVPVGHPADAAGWTRLLDDYRPRPVDAWQLRAALQQLGMADHVLYSGGDGGFSIAVLSFSSDPKALALGPQLAVFAASHRIATELVLGPQQEPNVAAALRTACAAEPSASSKRPDLLRVTVSDHGSIGRQPHGTLTIAVVVVDPDKPKMPDAMHTTATVIGVSASTATAEQLARVAVGAAAEGREVSGILVADPEPTDRTTGRLPRHAQPVRRRQVRPRLVTTEIRR